jgi:CheY-like chemotaxis protein
MLLQGLTVLVVEDESFVAMTLADMMRYDFGCGAVLDACTVAEALRLLEQQRPDLAVLDVNLGGQRVFPVAERLTAMGIPFVFETGYGRRGVPEQWRNPIVEKPFDAHDFEVAFRVLGFPR